MNDVMLKRTNTHTTYTFGLYAHHCNGIIQFLHLRVMLQWHTCARTKETELYTQMSNVVFMYTARVTLLYCHIAMHTDIM